MNTGKGGKTYPVKWQLKKYDGKLISDSDAQALLPYIGVNVNEVSCGTFMSMQESVLQDVTATETSLRYDAKAHQFIYNYKSPKTAGCYVLSISRADGVTTKRLNFQFTG